MKKIVCELCDNTEFVKEGGFFICQNCGTKYSLEEAKRMMQEVEGTVPVSIGAPVGSVPIDYSNQAQIDNMLLLATNAFEASNNQEAENYCNRVIELDAMSYKAWLLKGKAAGWSSSLGNNRMQEAAHSFCKAIDFAPENEKDDIKSQAVEELRKFGMACISLRRKNFKNNQGTDQLKGFRTDRKILLEALAVLISHGNEVGIPEGYQEEIAKEMSIAGTEGYLAVLLEEVGRSINNLARNRMSNDSDLLTKFENCATLIQDSIDASENDDEEDIERYQRMIDIYKHIHDMDCCSDSKKKDMKEKISVATVALAKVEKREQARAEEEARKAEEEKQARIKAYWEAHADEKASLEDEKEDLTEKKNKLAEEIKGIECQMEEVEEERTRIIPSEEERNNILNQIRNLNNRRSKLGLFAGKEKKRIGEEIAVLEGRKRSLDQKIEEEKSKRSATYLRKINPLRGKNLELTKDLEKITKRIAIIDDELTKDPKD